MIVDIKNYWDDGRGRDLVRYAVFACAIALVEWLLQLQNLFVLWYYSVSIFRARRPIVGISLVRGDDLLAVAWVAVVVIAFRNCGWPAGILLLSLPWGLRLFTSIEPLFEGACFFFDGCL